MPPLTAGELVLGFIAGSVTRGVIVGVLVGTVMWLFTDLQINLIVIFTALVRR